VSEPVVLAMGGNSLLDPALPPSGEGQIQTTAKAVVPIADLVARGVHLVVTHGNGPQVGFRQLRSELAKSHIYEETLDVLGADSQGGIGYMIQRLLREELERRGVRAEVVSVITETLVDPADRAFQHPTKPIGKFYSEAEADHLRRERGWAMVEDSLRGWRRVVPSPRPKEIVQLPTIRRLVESGVTVISTGGGGIPVMRDAQGRIRGLEAVIDKDRATALLAVQLGVKRLLITTGVDAIYKNFRSPDRIALRDTTPAELRYLGELGEFPPGSMGPKVEAAAYFLENGGQEVVICKPEDLALAFDGKAGTRIHPDRRGA
jgi:carbamate kinase